jgi:hypothetical protein
MDAPVQVREKLATLTERSRAMKRHRVFSMVRSTASLQRFMEWHVFAVWDFMALVKRLQRDMSCVAVPWHPPASPRAARLINEIVLGEESDTLPDGGHASHFDMYLMAMTEVGARTQQITRFVDLVRHGSPVGAALQQVRAAPALRTFVHATVETALNGSTPMVAGSFFYGREDAIPQMFLHLLDTWTIDPSKAPIFVYYLQRHIEVDGDSHGPAAQLILRDLLGDDVAAWDIMLDAALSAVDHRVQLWNALAHELERADTAATA